ncbi:MAG: hypothetical protein LBN94_01345 [Puniceicoccales bacterium]|jgi:hypothetical protein|nr:hypothetical protein [Puniceicoccales bacterium]
MNVHSKRKVISCFIAVNFCSLLSATTVEIKKTKDAIKETKAAKEIKNLNKAIKSLISIVGDDEAKRKTTLRKLEQDVILQKTETEIRKKVIEKTAMDTNFLINLRNLLQISEQEISEGEWTTFQNVLNHRHQKTNQFTQINREVCDAIKKGNIEALENTIDQSIGEQCRQANANGDREKIQRVKDKYNLVNLEKRCHDVEKNFSWLELAAQKGNTEIVALLLFHCIFILEEEPLTDIIQSLKNIASQYDYGEMQTFLENFITFASDEEYLSFFEKIRIGPMYFKDPTKKNLDPQKRNINFAREMVNFCLKKDSQSVYS